MQENRPSSTALGVAFRRAAHQVFDVPLIFQDKLAIKILGTDSLQKITENTDYYQAPMSRALRAFVSARSRYAEDKLAQAVSNGVRQYVLLGAGLDTFAYRNPYPDLHVFEVDHPATQGWKCDLLAKALIPIPGSMSFVPVDFEKDILAERLAAAGFQVNQPAFFGWLGVTPYLTLEAFRTTLKFLGSLPNKTGVAFDYGLSPHLFNAKQMLAFEALAKRVEGAGEPFRLFFSPQEVEEELQQAGFNEIEDLDGEAIKGRYFANRTDGLAVGSLGRIASGWKR